MRYQHHGYILVFSLMMIALVMIMVTGVVQRARVHAIVMKTSLDREKARLLALSGLEFAKSRLANPPEPEQKKEGGTTQTPSAEDPTQQARDFLAITLPFLATWQNFTVEGGAHTYGTVKICIGCESGKINLNTLYDFSKHQIAGQGDTQRERKLFLEQVCTALEKQQGGKELFQKLSKFLQECDYPLNDPTEILSIPEFDTVFQNNLFFEPRTSNEQTPEQKLIKEPTKPEVRPLCLMDIFTIWSSDATLEPWLLSPSLKQIFGFKQPGKTDEAIIKQALQKFTINASWSKDWDQTLGLLYGKDFASLSKPVASLLSTKFEPMVFSVVSYGSVKASTQKLYAIVERKRSSDKDGPLYEILVKRLYWL
jgi:hypothetical protein